MKTFLSLALVALALVASAPSQITPAEAMDQYALVHTDTLAAATTAITVQQPTSGSKLVLFMEAVVFCDGACGTVEVAIDGTAASTTAAAGTPVGRSRSASTVNEFVDSNASGGTVVCTMEVAVANDPKKCNLTGVALPSGQGSSRNLTLRMVDPYTGNVSLKFVYRED